MKPYRLITMPEPQEIRIPGQRKQTATVAILHGQKVLFTSTDEKLADAVTRHLNKIERGMKG